MKILYPLRFDAAEKGGGDVIQLQNYARFVKDAGGEVVFSSSLEPDAQGVDLVHASNIDRPETYFQVMSLVGRYPNLPIILTPIHHSNIQRRKYEAHGRRGALRVVNALIPTYQSREVLKFLFRGLKSSALFFAALRFATVRAPQKKIASKASLALLASETERKWCEEDYHIQFARSEVFPNGFQRTGRVSDAGTRDIDVIMTGRIEGRKNQVAVMKALSGSNVKMTLLGATNQRHQRYLTEFKDLLTTNPTYEYLGSRPHPETLALLARAKVYVSASWLEVLSLSDLEAFAAGCRVVASTHGSTREVLGDRVRYVNPSSIEEIREVVFQELASTIPENVNGRAELIEKYQWEKLGKALIEIYEREIRNRR